MSKTPPETLSCTWDTYPLLSCWQITLTLRCKQHYSLECVEGYSLLKKSLSDRSMDQNSIRTLPKRFRTAAKAGR
jgi:hypothetical protein